VQCEILSSGQVTLGNFEASLYIMMKGKAGSKILLTTHGGAHYLETHYHSGQMRAYT